MTREEIESRYERASDDYWTRHEAKGFIQRDGATHIPNPYGLDLFMHAYGLHGSAVSEGYTGLQIELCEGHDADAMAMASALMHIGEKGAADYWGRVGRGIETSGLSPRYRERVTA